MQAKPFQAIILCVFGCLFSPILQAQTAEDEVRKLIEKLFESMQTADANALAQIFTKDARLFTVIDHEEGAKLAQTPISDFIAAVGSTDPGVLDERILRYEIRVDEKLASAWTPYIFYRADEFSHCGVNTFQLYKSDQGWQIISIVDNRRKEDCPE